jgi:hypothetical protein
MPADRDLGAAAVGFELARATDCHLDQAGSQRRQDGHQDSGQWVRRPPFAVAATKERSEIGEHADRTGHRGADGRDQDVAMPHVR